MGYFLTAEAETAVPAKSFAIPKTHAPEPRGSAFGMTLPRAQRMNLLPFVLVGFVIGLTCRADEFLLKDAKGKEYGPFETRSGAKLHIGGEEYEVVKAVSPRDAVIQAMQRIVLPEVEFRQTSIQDVIAFLGKASREQDPAKQGVNLILVPSVGGAPAPDARPVFTNVNLSARNVSLYSLIKTVRQVTGFKVCVDGAGVRFMLPDEPESEILHRQFRVEPTYIERIGEGGTNATSEASCLPDLKRYFGLMGVQWPRGSSIVYNSGVGLLLVANTAANLALLDGMLCEMRCLPRQIEIEAQLVRFETTNLAHLARGHMEDRTLFELWSNGCGRVVAAPRVATRSGAEATVRGVTEVIYPTTFDTNTVGCLATNGVTEMAVMPSDLATREVGAVLTVLPEVSPDGELVNLTLTPQFVDPPVWKDLSEIPTGGWHTRYVPAAQPYFHVASFNTQLSLADGATAVAGGGVPTGDGQGLVYCFVTVRLLGVDGERLRKPDAPQPVRPCEF